MNKLVAGMATMVGLAALVPTPGGAAEPIPTASVYAHCGATKVGQGSLATYTWNATKPTASVTTGAGCGQLDSDKTAGDGIQLTGTYTGLLDKLTVRFWVIDAGPVRAGAYGEWFIDTAIDVDGGAAGGSGEVHVTPVESSTGASRLVEISVTGIGLTDPKNADHTKLHNIAINLESASYLDGDQIAWVLDTSEVDSGVVFSPASLAPAVLDVTYISEE
jgi:hypothetical protein